MQVKPLRPQGAVLSVMQASACEMNRLLCIMASIKAGYHIEDLMQVGSLWQFIQKLRSSLQHILPCWSRRICPAPSLKSGPRICRLLEG